MKDWLKEEVNRRNLQELLRKFDGPGGDVRLAWYGQCRAHGLTHDEAISDTFLHFQGWCREVWPKRGIEVPPTERKRP